VLAGIFGGHELGTSGKVTKGAAEVGNSALEWAQEKYDLESAMANKVLEGAKAKYPKVLDGTAKGITDKMSLTVLEEAGYSKGKLKDEAGWQGMLKKLDEKYKDYQLELKKAAKSETTPDAATAPAAEAPTEEAPAPKARKAVKEKPAEVEEAPAPAIAPIVKEEKKVPEKAKDVVEAGDADKPIQEMLKSAKESWSNGDVGKACGLYKNAGAQIGKVAEGARTDYMKKASGFVESMRGKCSEKGAGW
jgi:hypothetical protein